MISFTTRRVAAAGASTIVTGVAPAKIPSREPSTKVAPVSSAQWEDQSGFVVAGGPAMRRVIVLTMLSKTRIFMSG
jgi:hypothetical protein